YMRVSTFVTVHRLPRTMSGKVDRAALPAPEPEPASDGPKELPRTAVERAIAEVWQQVLGTTDEIGVHDDFFDLGGHSLLATRVVFGLRRALGVEVPVHTVFDAPTIASLATQLRPGEAVPGADAPPLARVPRDGVLPLSYAQERLYFLWRLAPESPAYNAPIALRLRGRLDVNALSQAL